MRDQESGFLTPAGLTSHVAAANQNKPHLFGRKGLVVRVLAVPWPSVFFIHLADVKRYPTRL